MNDTAERAYLVPLDGEADESTIWVGNIREGRWETVPGPLSALVLWALPGALSQAMTAALERLTATRSTAGQPEV